MQFSLLAIFLTTLSLATAIPQLPASQISDGQVQAPTGTAPSAPHLSFAPKPNNNSTASAGLFPVPNNSANFTIHHSTGTISHHISKTTHVTASAAKKSHSTINTLTVPAGLQTGVSGGLLPSTTATSATSVAVITTSAPASGAGKLSGSLAWAGLGAGILMML
ncbi:hypothetical protein MMC20_002345 [Loxospora ochrophaea]|nr:hypothetical protein [Loxospora ochrophaea]